MNRPAREGLRGLIGRLRRDDRGGVALEFSIVAVAFVVVSLGVIEFGRALQVRNELSFAADYGARQIMMDPAASESVVTAAIRDKFMGYNPADLAVSFGDETLDGISYRTIILSYPMQIFIPFVNRSLTLEVERRTPSI